MRITTLRKCYILKTYLLFNAFYHKPCSQRMLNEIAFFLRNKLKTKFNAVEYFYVRKSTANISKNKTCFQTVGFLDDFKKRHCFKTYLFESKVLK